MTRVFPYILLAVKVALIIWGAMGMWEYLDPSVAFGLQNPDFPAGVQLIHWKLLLLTGGIFCAGFILRWRHTPYATIIMYATLATLCFIETVDFNAFGGGATGRAIMFGEFLLYLMLATYLLQSREIAMRFARPLQ